MFFGLQYILKKWLVGVVITQQVSLAAVHPQEVVGGVGHNTAGIFGRSTSQEVVGGGSYHT